MKQPEWIIKLENVREQLRCLDVALKEFEDEIKEWEVY